MSRKLVSALSVVLGVCAGIGWLGVLGFLTYLAARLSEGNVTDATLQTTGLLIWVGLPLVIITLLFFYAPFAIGYSAAVLVRAKLGYYHGETQESPLSALTVGDFLKYNVCALWCIIISPAVAIVQAIRPRSYDLIFDQTVELALIRMLANKKRQETLDGLSAALALEEFYKGIKEEAGQYRRILEEAKGRPLNEDEKMKLLEFLKEHVRGRRP